MENFNALLTLSELKTLYSGKPVGICPLYKGVLSTTKTFEATGNPVTLPEYKSLVKLTTQFSPKQAGTGDPSPDNVRPISGWDSVKVTVSNKSESHDYDITLPETIYGGTVDAVTGVGSKTWRIVKIDGTENWEKYSNVTTKEPQYRTNLKIDLPGITEGSKRFCTHFSTSDYEFWWQLKTNTFATDGTYICIQIDYQTVEEFKSYLSTQYAAGTPVSVCYKLATPEPFKVSQFSIPSLGGENKFFTNGENMDIIYNETSFWG